MTSKLFFAGAALLLVQTLSAQQAFPGTGTVTGHVTAGDTQRPARFATVALFEIPAKVSAVVKPDPDADTEAQMLAAIAALSNVGKANMVQSQAGVDGAFVAMDVPPGDYYVFAAATGYISPRAQVLAALASGADTKKTLPGIPIVHVTAEHTSLADVTLVRGGAISGTISWDDGSPVTGAIMAVLPASGEAKTPPEFNMLGMANALGGLSISNDLGQFRISGLAPGEYILQATVQAGQQMSFGSKMNLSKMMAVKPLLLFAPAAFHKEDAKPITVRAGEDLSGQMMTLNLSSLHSVSGRIASAEDHHGLNSGTVRLQDTKDKEFVRTGALDAKGNYTVTFMPPGTFTLKISDGEDTEPKKEQDSKSKIKIFAEETTLKSYKAGELSVLVADSDVTGQDLELAVDKHPKTDADLDKMLKDLEDKPEAK